jgi:hypothetical protein
MSEIDQVKTAQFALELQQTKGHLHANKIRAYLSKLVEKGELTSLEAQDVYYRFKLLAKDARQGI